MKSCLEKLKNNISDKRTIITAFIFVIGFLARFVFLGAVPDGLNQDEAYAGYEAYSLLHYGVDSWGYSFPVYLTTWGSGMSIMNAYLMIPFIAFFGPSAFAIRLPQAILGIVTLVFFYKLFKLFFKDDDLIQIIALFILAINPWHILMCRWALDCNMAPVFCLIAFYYFCKGVDEPKYYMLSALFYGFTLYCYALTWILVPIIVVLQGIYLILTKKYKFSVYLIWSAVIFFILALPLLLFIMVNSGKIAEFQIGFISIPKMPMFRASEIAIGHRKARFFGFIANIIHQNDGLIWNYAGKYGLYYIWGLLFSFIGFVELLVLLVKSVVKRLYRPEIMVLIPIVICLIFSSLLDANFSKLNLFHLPMIAMSVFGIRRVLKLIRKEKLRVYLAFALTIFALIPFILFELYYFGDYKSEIASNYKTGLEDCLKYSDSIFDGSMIYINDYSAHPCVLFYEQIPVGIGGLDCVREAGFAVYSVSGYTFSVDEAGEGDICILNTNFLPNWFSDEMILYSCGEYLVAEKRGETDQ